MSLEMTPLTHSSFEAFVTTHRFVVVHFWAPWNGYDAEMKRFLETEALEELRVIAVGTMEIDAPENAEICIRHNIRNIPFLAFYRDGSVFASVTGLDKDKVTYHLRQMVKSQE
jgi:thioredoxin-like negative regulator of GroEL